VTSCDYFFDILFRLTEISDYRGSTVFHILFWIYCRSWVTCNTPVVSYIMLIAPTVTTFLVRGNVFRTSFSMTSRLQGRGNSPLRQTWVIENWYGVLVDITESTCSIHWIENKILRTRLSLQVLIFKVSNHPYQDFQQNCRKLDLCYIFSSNRCLVTTWRTCWPSILLTGVW
jgi:hypothetical protein